MGYYNTVEVPPHQAEKLNKFMEVYTRPHPYFHDDKTEEIKVLKAKLEEQREFIKLLVLKENIVMFNVCNHEEELVRLNIKNRDLELEIDRLRKLTND